MTKDQNIDALKQARSFCANREARYNDGDLDAYVNVSLREVLYELGFESDEADSAITYAHDNGFAYLVDPMFKVRSEGIERDEYPPLWACSWGIDQLRSRLDCVSGVRF